MPNYISDESIETQQYKFLGVRIKLSNKTDWDLQLLTASDKQTQTEFTNTVKPVYNDHPWNPKFVVAVNRWSLFRGIFWL